MKKSRKRIAVLNITSRCNLRCGFCFGPEDVTGVRPLGRNRYRLKPELQKVKKELSTVQAKNLITKLKKFALPRRQAGAKILIFSGGEPLLRKDIFELICFAKKLGFFTVLHTNGMLLNRMTLWKLTVAAPFRVRNNRRLKPAATKLKSCLDQINLPLDGYNAKTNDAMRCKGHFKKVMQALKLLSSLAGHKPRSARLKNSKIRVIISTVASAKNKDAVPKIARILPKWIHKWRIFQFNPQGKAAAVKKEFGISDEKFEEIQKEIYRLKSELQNIKVQCVGAKDKEFRGSYEII